MYPFATCTPGTLAQLQDYESIQPRITKPQNRHSHLQQTFSSFILICCNLRVKNRCSSSKDSVIDNGRGHTFWPHSHGGSWLQIDTFTRRPWAQCNTHLNNMSTQRFYAGHFFTTRLYNTSVQHVLLKYLYCKQTLHFSLLYNTSVQHARTTLLHDTSRKQFCATCESSNSENQN